MIDDRPFAEPFLQSIRAGEIRPHVFQSRFPFVTKNELNFAELDGLKSGCCLEPVAKTRKRRWRHRFENVDLRDEHLHDRAHAFEGMNRPEEITARKIMFYFFEFV